MSAATIRNRVLRSADDDWRVLLEQTFAPATVERLLREPELLAGRSCEATMLFADLRGFTAIAEGLPPETAFALLGDVMELLSDAVLRHEGVVVDYYGDGLAAMWNAPLEQPHHADLACGAGLAMLEEMPAIAATWTERIGLPLELSVGIHTGVVQVGNAGTRRRFKYGPRGSAMNIASRVQSASKQLDVPLVATAAVRQRLTGEFTTHRLCTARLPGLEQPLELIAVQRAADEQRVRDDIERYAAALAAFERGDLDAAERGLADLIARGASPAARFLAAQAAAVRGNQLGRRAGDTFRPGDGVVEILSK
ncbi:MAG: adenylate/guanylate cyclase domain-containing protein [Pirellulales bacterium]|nr:adenylate/guanylate cyclase domain-containing protein [Pirellulales bacterium]MBX3432030.1 adenylate/guanylate cyclase domain-containing protein [Pirellulales bacterium]